MFTRVLAAVLLFLLTQTVQAQRLRQFSGPDDYEKEVFDAILLSQKEKKLFQDSIVPQFMALYEGPLLAQWIDVSNMMLRKRITTADFWEDFFRLAVRAAEVEDSSQVEQLLAYVKSYARTSPARDIRVLVHRMYLAEVKRMMGDEGAIWKAPYSEWTLVFEEGVPMWQISDGDIIGRFRKDSTIVVGTVGRFNPELGQFDGYGGTAYWSRVGLSEDDAYATLTKWNLDISSSGFDADSALLHTTRYIDEPILGKFEERLSNSGERSNFPRFRSYRYDYLIPNILENIHYQGGISVIGNNFFGGSLDDQFARLRFTYEGDTIVSIRSNQFRLGDDQLQSNNVQVVAYVGEEDSIYHRSCEMRYVSNTGELRITRLNTGLGLSSFNNTYHNLNMSVDQMIWRQGTAFIDFQNLNLGSQAEAVFESSQYFRVLLMDQIAGLQRQHPLVVLSAAAESLGGGTMDSRELIRALRMPYEEGLHFLYQMAILGFAEMDEVKELYTLSPRVSEFLLNYAGKRDYDVIQFVSRVSEGANARLSLLNYELEMAGIGQFAVSDSQEVYITPRKGLVNMRENLNFSFDGRINAGLFSFWGTEFTFSYDLFNVDMPRIDSMRFKVREFDSDRGDYAALVNVQTALQDLIGQIEIDKPNNKSSRVVYPEYPIFTTTNSSFVYYDKPEIHRGAYERERFFMKVNPFSIDSLNNTSTDGISFDATWHSGGIFPTME